MKQADSFSLPYDKTDPASIESYAKKLEGQTFEDVLIKAKSKGALENGVVTGVGNAPHNRGLLGVLLEENYFQYKANSESEPDFKEAGVELKTTPYEITKAGKKRAGERLVLSMINYSGPIENDFYASHVWKKCRTLLLVFYLRDRNPQDRLKCPIHYVSLFTPSETDLAIIKNDYRIIAEKIISGKADKLSESDTFYLGACTKGATAEKSFTRQYYEPHTKAKTRAFCYKNSYMTHVLNEYIIKEAEAYEPIIKNASELAKKTFADFIIEKIDLHRGKTDKQLCGEFDRLYNNNKAQWTDLVYRMLGIKSNRAEEFRKANVVIKVIRLEENGKMKESMSFPPFKYRELAKENWEDSTLHNYFDETKFLFVVFKRSGKCYVLKGCQLWNMPCDDLNQEVKQGWTNVVKRIREGINLTIVETKAGPVVKNDLPTKAENRIIHVRPHAKKRYYEFLDGKIIGDGSRSDANQLPNGIWMPNYSFWINNDYILSQLGNYAD